MNRDTDTLTQNADLAGYQLRDPHRPARVVRPNTAEEVQIAVRDTAEHDGRLAVQGTGHGRTRGMDGDTLILTRGLRQVQIDPTRRTARIGAGTQWDAVIAAAAPYGLAPLSGSAPSVGVTGYTLGAGFGLLSPRFGYAADHVRAVELITPDGEFHRADAEHDTELFWALRGGGARFGVVTALEIDLFPIRQLVGGTVFYDLAAEPDLLLRWQDWCSEQPSQALAAATALPFPDVPGVPLPLRGHLVAQLHLAWSDDSTSSEEAVRGLRSLGRPLHDSIGTLPYARSGEIFADPEAPGSYRGSGWLLDRLPVEPLSELPERLQAQSAMTVIGIRRLGGAMSNAPAAPNAVGHRSAAWSLGVLSVPGADPTPERTGHDHLLSGWRTAVTGRALNFTFDDLDPDDVSQGWESATVARLRKLLDQVDPNRMIIGHHRL